MKLCKSFYNVCAFLQTEVTNIFITFKALKKRMESQIREHSMNPAAREEAADAMVELNDALSKYNALSRTKKDQLAKLGDCAYYPPLYGKQCLIKYTMFRCRQVVCCHKD